MTQDPGYEYIDENRRAIVDILKKQGINLVPIPQGRGKALGFGWDRWCSEKCSHVILDKQDFAVFEGITSDNLAILDLEMRNTSNEERDKTLLPIIQEVFPNATDITLVVETGNGYHVYFKTHGRALRSSDFKKNEITIEIKGQGKYVVGPSSKHYDKDEDGNYVLSGKVYKIISNTTEIITVDPEEFLKNLLSKGWSATGKHKKVSELYEGLKDKGENSNRQEDLIRILSSIKIKNPEFTFNDISYHGYTINSQFKTPYPHTIVDEKIKNSWNFACDVLSNRINEILEKDELFSKLWNQKPESNKVAQTAYAIVTICYKTGFIVVKSELKKKLHEWCKLHNVNPDLGSKDIDRAVTKVIENIFSDSKKFPEIKKICYDLGVLQKPITFDHDQMAEAGEWIKGRYNIKRIELTGDLIYFNERNYEGNAKEFIKNVASSCLVKHSNKSVNEVVGYVERTAPIIKNTDIEKHVHLKCLLDGIYNIKTGEFTEKFNPDYIILNLIPHNFDESVKYTNIQNIISDILDDKKDQQTYFDFASTCLHPYTGIDFQLGLVGPPGSGKTTLLKMLDRSFGPDNVAHATIHLIAKDMTTQKDVAFKFLNSDEDLSSEDIKQTDVIKKWITQDKFTGRSIYAHSSTFRPTSRLMFNANGIYEISNPDDAQAVYQRTHIIKVKNLFRGTPREKKALTDKIDEKEYGGFVTYLLKNATEIYDLQKIHYPQNTKTTENLWNEYGNNIRAFIETWIERGSDYKIPSTEIWSKWLSHSIECRIPPKGKTQFYKKFDEIIGNSAIQIRLDKDTNCWGYLGLRLKSPNEVMIQQTFDKTTKGEIITLIKNSDINEEGLEKIKEFVTNVSKL
ncbi:MAG: DUF5906 domain-containing protein [Nitrosarchaeum sp.]|nr:DUF5906 domain-containing protein [Nitrosarchaeum sp.]